MGDESIARKIVIDNMLPNDSFSRWLDIEVTAVHPGSCVLKATIREDMVNGFGICHGGITFSLADSALAFASNGYGRHAVSVETSISHCYPAKTGDRITATAHEKHRSHNIGVYEVVLQNQDGRNIAFFKGTVYFKSTEWSL